MARFVVASSSGEGGKYATSTIEYFCTAADNVKVTVLVKVLTAILLTVLTTVFSLTVNIEVVGKDVESSWASYCKTIVFPSVVFVALTNEGSMRDGVTELEAIDEAEGASPLLATAVNVYEVPFVKPVTSQLPELPDTVHVAEPGVAVMVKLVGEVPEPADTVTAADFSRATAVGAGGTPGES